MLKPFSAALESLETASAGFSLPSERQSRAPCVLCDLLQARCGTAAVCHASASLRRSRASPAGCAQRTADFFGAVSAHRSTTARCCIAAACHPAVRVGHAAATWQYESATPLPPWLIISSPRSRPNCRPSSRPCGCILGHQQSRPCGRPCSHPPCRSPLCSSPPMYGSPPRQPGLQLQRAPSVPSPPSTRRARRSLGDCEASGPHQVPSFSPAGGIRRARHAAYKQST
mmetsp:Transcript_14496/g.42268  ORF Transcript_14496/g.42268 Transcript_14496/m.42268 type:complete len:228 (-) Transcript_14496:1111-1794(-)